MARNVALVAALVVLIVGGWFLFTRIFPSEQRRLEWTLEDLRKAVESGDARRCLAFISPEYDYDRMDHKALEAFAEATLRLSGQMKVKILKQEVKVLPGNKLGVSASEILSLPCPGSNLPSPVKTSWNLAFRKEGDEWKIWQIELNSLNDQALRGGLRELLRLAQ